MASGWGSLNNIIAEAEARKAEEEKRAAMVRALEQRQQGPRPAPTPLPNPWQAPVFSAPPISVSQPPPNEQLYQVGRPPTDTGPADFSSSQSRSDTAQSRLPQQPMQPVSSIAPRPMLPSLSDRLRDPYNAPQQQPNPWQPPTFGQTNVPRYELQSDEPYGVNRQRIIDAQPDPIQNRIGNALVNSPVGQAVGQFGQAVANGGQGISSWWDSQKGYRDPRVQQAADQNQFAIGGITNSLLDPNAPSVAEWWGQQPSGQYVQQQFQNRWDKANDTLPGETWQQVKDAPGWIQTLGQQAGLTPDAINKAWRTTTIPGTQTAWAAVDDPLKYAGAIGMGMVDIAFDMFGRLPASTPRDELGAFLAGQPMSALSGKELPIMAEPLAVGGVIGQAIKENTYGNPLKFLWNLTVGSAMGQGLTQQVGERGNELFAADQYQANMDAWWNTKKYYDNLSPQAKQDTGIGWAMAVSGPNAVMNSITDIETWDAQIATKEEAAAQAQLNGDMMGAAQLGREINRMKNMSKVDIIEQHMNIGAELVYGILVDPVSVGGDLLATLTKTKTLPRYMADADKVFGIDKAGAKANIDKALNEAQALLDSAMGGSNIKAKTWWDSVNPLTMFKRTPAANANRDTNWLLSTVAQVTQGVTGKDDAKLLLAALQKDATTLLEGVPLSTSNAQFRGAGNLTRFDPGVVGNVHAAQRIPILKLLPEGWIDNLRSLKGEGQFDPVEFLAEVDGVLFDASRRWNGLGSIKNMPVGAVDTRVKRLPDGTAVIEYVGKDKKVIRTSEAMTYNEAYTQVQDIKNAASATNPGDMAMGALKGVANFQRGILADQYLALSPRNWIRNTVGAWTMAYSADSYSFKNTAGILEELARDGGGTPSTLRPFTAMTGYNRGQELGAAQPTTGFIGPLAEKVTRNPDNIVTRFMKGGYNQAYGNKEVPLGFGQSVGRSEESNFLKVFHAGYSKTKHAAWDYLADNLLSDMTKENVPGDWARQLRNMVSEQGPNSSQNDLMNKLYDYVMSDEAQITTLNALGVDRDLLPFEQWGKLVDDVLGNIDTLSDEEAINQVMDVFDEARQWPARQLSQYPPQQGRYKWTTMENMYEGGLVEQSMTDAAARAGVPAEEAKPIIDGVVQTIQGANDQWGVLRQDYADLAQRANLSGNGTDLYHVAMDFVTDAIEAKDGARAIVDKAARHAVAMQTPEAWLGKWTANVQAWGQYGEKLTALTTDYRGTLGKVAQGGEYTPKTDLNKLIMRWMKFDPAKLETARAYALSAPVSDDAWMWEEVITQNRAKLDNAILTATEAFKRYPSSDNFDLLSGLMQEADEMGAKAASFLADAKAKGAQGARYHSLRNQTWTQYFDDATAYTQTMAKVMVALGVSDDIGDAVKWTDDFSGGEFRLLYPNEDGTWQAMNTATKQQMTFSAPAQGFGGDARPEVPQGVMDAFNTAIGRNDEMVSTIMGEVQAAADSAPTTVSSSKIQAGTEMLWRVNDSDNPVVITGSLGKKDGLRYYSIEGSSTGVPENQLLPAPTVMNDVAPAVDDVRPLPDSPDAPGYVAPEPSAPSTRKGKAPKPTSVGDVAKMDAQVAKETRTALQKAWDSQVVARYTQTGSDRSIPDLTTLARQYNHGGMVNMNLNRSEVKRFEDIYGVNVGGYQIDNQDDLTRFLQQYVDLQKQVDGGYAAARKSSQFSKMSAREIVAQTRDEFVAAGYSDAEIKALAQDRRGLLDTLATIRGDDPDEFGLVGYDFRIPTFNETDEGKDLFQTLYSRIAASRRNGGMKAQEVGEGAADLLYRLNRAEEKLVNSIPNIRNGRIPNALTPQQRLKVWDKVRAVVDKHPNVTAQANYVGDKIGNWVMLNRSTDERHADAIIDLLMPFGFFRSRMGSRLASIPVNKPGLVNLYYEVQGAIDDYHEGAGTPVRLQDSVPLGGKWFIGNPLAWAIPFNVYAPDPYSRPRPEDGDVEKRVNSVMQWLGGSYPVTQAAIAATLDMVEPKKDGTRRTDDFELGDIIPSYRTGGYIIQSLTGKTGPGGFLKWGDQYDPYRAKRTVGALVAEEKINPTVGQYAQQVIQNRYDRKDDSNNVDPVHLGKAIELADRAMKETGQEQAITTGSSLLSGTPVRQYRPGEKEMRDASKAYNELKYDPNTNPYGSKAAAGSWMDANPALASWWTKDDAAPGDSGRLNTLYGQKEKLQAQQKAAEEAAVQALDLSAAGRGDIYDARAAAREPFQAQLDAINAEIDDVKSRQPLTVRDRQKGMNPQEVSTSFANSVMWQATQVPGKPEYPGDDATSQEWDAYNKQRAAYDKAQEKFIVNALTQVPTSDVVRERRGPVKYTANQAIELWWNFNHNRELPEERARLEQLDRESANYNAASKAQMQSAKERVKGGDKLLQEYLDTPAGEERDALKDKDWRYRAVTMAAYNAPTYDALKEQFGEDGIRQYYEAMGKSPEWPGDNATEAEMQAYYKASNEFDAKYPKRDEVSLWLNGRYTYGDANSSTQPGTYDQGTDYAKAVEIFTPRIFEIERNFNEASLNGTWSAYRNAHPADYALLIGFGEWKKAGQNLPQGMGDLPTARWGANPATQNASYATDADRNAFANGQGPQQGGAQGQQPFNQVNLPFMPTMAMGNQGTPQAQPKSPTLGSTQMAGVNAPANADAPRTAQQWANQNAKYVEGVRIGAEIQARRGEVGAAWGEEALAQWDSFFALPKDSAARQAYKDANPIVRAMLLTAYNPTQYQQALADGFSNEDILAWAGRPPYEGDGSARSAYWDSNPNGWRFNAYLNGRPQAYDPKSDNEDFTYNWGADYNQAKELYGENIWDVVMMQRSLPDDKVARAQFYEANPQYSAWADWWYGNLPDNGYVGAASNFGGRSYGGYGGGGGGGGGLSRGYAPQINPRYMDSRLWDAPMQGQRQWIPYSNPTPDWLRAGDRVQPDPIRKWIPPKF